MVSYIKKALTSTLIIYVFAIIGSFFAYLVRILFARNLSVAEYGLFFAVFGLLSLVFVFKDLGYGLTIIRFTPEFIVKKQMSYVKSSIVLTFIIQLVYSLIAAVIFFMLANYLSVNFFHDELAGNLIKLLVVFLLSL